MTLHFTVAPYVRSHGTQPRGRGSWGFQISATWVGYDRDLSGEVFFATGTLTEAKRAARAHFGSDELLAVLP